MPDTRFFVPGIPRPGGSKKGFYIPPKQGSTGQVIVPGRVVITEDNEHSKDWRSIVALAGSVIFKEPLRGALAVRFEFFFPRPKRHYGAAGVRRSAPRFPAVKPDTTKLIRSTEDALKGIAWCDDAQIVSQFATKAYGPQAGAWITIAPMTSIAAGTSTGLQPSLLEQIGAL